LDALTTGADEALGTRNSGASIDWRRNWENWRITWGTSDKAGWIVDAGCIPKAAVTLLTSAAVDIEAWIGGRAAGHVDALANLALLTLPAVDIEAWIRWNASVNVDALTKSAPLANSAVDVLAQIDNRRYYGNLDRKLDRNLDRKLDRNLFRSYFFKRWNPTATPEIREHDSHAPTPNASFAIVAYLPPTSVMIVLVLAFVLAIVLGPEVVSSSRTSPEPSAVAVLAIVIPSGLLVVTVVFDGVPSAILVFSCYNDQGDAEG